MKKRGTKKEAIIYIEKEIDTISDKEKTAGWTRWGIITAIAYIVSILASIFETKEMSGPNIFYTYFSIVLFLDIFYFSTRGLLNTLRAYYQGDLGVRIDGEHNRIRYINGHVSFGKCCLEFIKASLFAAMSYILFCNYTVSRLSGFVVAVNIGAALMGIIIIFWKRPIPSNLSKNMLGTNIINFLLTLFYIFCITGILFDFGENGSMAVGKSSILSYIVYLLLCYYCQSEHNSDTKNNLLLIRRKLLAREEKDAEDLVELSEIVLFGYTANQIFGNDINTISKKMLTMEQEIDNLDKIIVRIYKLSNTERNIYNNVKEIKEEMCLSQKSSDKTLLLFELIKKEYDKLAKKYKSTSPELYIDFQQAIALIVKKNKSYTVKIKMIRGKIREIRTRIEKQGATTTAKKKLN